MNRSIDVEAVPAVRLDPAVRRRGRTVIGGVPVRVLRLSDTGVAVVARLAEGERPWSPASASLARRLLRNGFAHPVVATTTCETGRVTAVVPVRDDPGGLERLLGSAAFAGVAEVIVVDDGSTDERVAGVAHRHGATLVSNVVAAGPGAARDRGWRAASSPLVAFVDADCLPEPGWLDGLLGYFADPEVQAVAPRVSGVHGDTTGVLARFESDHGPIDRGVGPAEVGVGAVRFVPSAALVVRRAALEAVGGFDEALLVGEDVDLVWRLLGEGSVRYEPGVRVTHRSRAGIRSWLHQRFRYGTSAAPLDERHPGRLHAGELNPWTAGSWALLLFAPRRWRWLGVVAGLVSTGLLARRFAGRIDAPVRSAVELAGQGNVVAGRWLVEVARREWWPVVVAGSLVSRRLRAHAVVAFVVAPLLRAAKRRPAVGVASAAALDVADDVAYGAGVWAGCVRERRFGPLLPRLRRRRPGG